MPPKLSSYLHVLLLLLIHLLTSQSRTLKSNSAAQSSNFLQNLNRSQKGKNVEGLNHLKQYLKNFGYYPNDQNINDVTDDFDDLLETALKSYQRNYNLKVTGILDSDTINQMMIPRCGLPDQHPTQHGNKSNNPFLASKYTFFTGQPRWPSAQTHLTYTFYSSVQAIGLQELRSACSNAFQKWQAVTQFTFEEVAYTSQADIVIGFHRLDHGDGYPFDGRGNVLAHAFAPTSGRLHIDADENWSTNNPGMYEMDLESVAVHEIGHVLGLGHSMDRDAVMFPSISTGTIKRDLGQDDIYGISSLYSN